MTGAACPAQACYVVSAVPAAAAGLDGIPNTKLLPQYAVDGNTATRFTDGTAQVGGEYFQIDLCQAKYVNGLTVDDTVDTTDVATAFDVDVSLDGTCWETVFNSQNPAIPDEVVTFPSVLARFVRYTQTGNDQAVANAPWLSIDEITVQCGSAPPDGGADSSTPDSSTPDGSTPDGSTPDGSPDTGPDTGAE
jgi:hypothetical protein